MKRLLLCAFIVLASWGLAWADFGISKSGEQAAVTFTHSSACDSARIYFGYDGDGGADTSNFYASLKLVPCFSGDGKILMGEGLELDSVGTHVIKITYYQTTDSGQVAGIWFHDDDAVGSSGDRTITITVVDIADGTTAISGFNVSIYDSSSGEFKGSKLTNSNGVATYSLSDETYTVHLSKTPWTLASPRYFIVTADMESTFYATAFSPTNPTAATKCKIYQSDVTDAGATSMAGCKLTARFNKKYRPVTYGGNIVSHLEMSAFSDDTGYVYLEIYKSSEVTAGDGTSTVKYDVKLFDPDGTLIAERKDYEVTGATLQIDWTP